MWFDGEAVSDQLEVLKLLAARLDAADLSYMITGSIAAGLYGQPRMTRDIDVVAMLYPPHAVRLGAILGHEFSADAASIREAIVARRMFSVMHREDLVLSKLQWAKDSRSELHLRDVRSIIALQPDLDWAYLDRWAIRLTGAGMLAEMRS